MKLKQFASVSSASFMFVLLAVSFVAAANPNPAKGPAVAISGAPVLTVSPMSVDFGSAAVNDYEYNGGGTVAIITIKGGYSIKGPAKGLKAQIFQIKNTGNGPMPIDDGFAVFSQDACRKIDYNPDPLCDFWLTANTCPKSLGAGGTCSLTVEFVPFRAGKLHTTLTLGGNSPGKANIQLSGIGTGNSGLTGRAAASGLTSASRKDVPKVRNKQEVIVSLKDAVSALGQPAKLQATVKSKADDTPAPGVDVRFKVNGKIVGTAKTGQDGIATYDYCTDWSLNPGANPIEADAVDNGLFFAGKGTGNLGVLKAVTTLTIQTFKGVGGGGVDLFGGVLQPNLPLAQTGEIQVGGYLQIQSACVIDMIKSNPFLAAQSVRVKSGGGVNIQAWLSAEGKYETSFGHQIGKTDPVTVEVSFDGDGKLLPSTKQVIIK